MTRITIILALLGSVLGGASLWIAAGAAEANAAEHWRITTARDELEDALLSMGRQIAELRSGLVELGNRRDLEAWRTVVVPAADQEAVSAANPGPDHGPADQGPESDPIDRARYWALSDDEKRDALEDLAKRAKSGDLEALAMVLDGMRDASPKVRKKAAKMLGDLADPALVGHLKQAASDPSADVRGSVADSLDELPVDAAGPILVDMLRDAEPDVVAEAIRSLVKLDYSAALPHLIGQLASQDLDIATRAASAVREQGDERSVLGTIDRIMNDYAGGDTKVRIRDVKWLRRIGGAAAITRLISIMETDASLSVREEARAALVKLGV